VISQSNVLKAVVAIYRLQKPSESLIVLGCIQLPKKNDCNGNESKASYMVNEALQKNYKV